MGCRLYPLLPSPIPQSRCNPFAGPLSLATTPASTALAPTLQRRVCAAADARASRRAGSAASTQAAALLKPPLCLRAPVLRSIAHPRSVQALLVWRPPRPSAPLTCRGTRGEDLMLGTRYGLLSYSRCMSMCITFRGPCHKHTPQPRSSCFTSRALATTKPHITVSCPRSPRMAALQAALVFTDMFSL